MKKLILITLTLILAMGIVWVPSVAAAGPYPIPITKTIPPGGPIEDFTFEAYRDMNNNGILDFDDQVWGPDILVGTVVITGAGSGVIDSPFMGNTIVHEVLAAGSAYEQQPDQIVSPPCGEVIFNNDVEVQEVGEIVILKEDPAGNALLGATFVITPDPKTGTGSLTVVDNGLNDELPLTDGVLLVTGCLVCIPVTVTETVPPPGYAVAPPQPAHVTTAGETVELTFTDTPELSCGTVCAAQTAPGEYLFGGGQSNWFTWIYYDKGWGTEGDPYEYPIYTGQTKLCGTLYVYDNGTHIFVNYVLTDMGACTLGGLSEYHLQVDKSFNDLKKAVVKKKNPIPGKCEYKGTFDPMQPATGWIEATEDDISGWTTAYIFAHGVGCYYCP